MLADLDLQILVTEAAEKLIANGGGTVEGMAAHLEAQGIRGDCRHPGRCILAEYFIGALADQVARVSMHVDTLIGAPGTIRVARTWSDSAGEVEVDPLLNELAIRFDRTEFLSLIRRDRRGPGVQGPAIVV